MDLPHGYVVYVIGVTKDKLVKIGCSGHLSQRLKNLRYETQEPLDLIIWRRCHDNLDMFWWETRIHNSLVDYWHHGEWFCFKTKTQQKHILSHFIGCQDLVCQKIVTARQNYVIDETRQKPALRLMLLQQ